MQFDIDTFWKLWIQLFWRTGLFPTNQSF